MCTKMLGCLNSKSSGQRSNYETDPTLFQIWKLKKKKKKTKKGKKFKVLLPPHFLFPSTSPSLSTSEGHFSLSSLYTCIDILIHLSLLHFNVPIPHSSDLGLFFHLLTQCTLSLYQPATSLSLSYSSFSFLDL